MSKVVRRTTIHAPADEVFKYLEDKNHFPEFWPSMMEVSDIRDLPTGGKHFHWVYKMAGVRFEGDTDEIEYIPNKKMVGQNLKGIESTITWELEDRKGDTELTFEGTRAIGASLGSGVIMLFDETADMIGTLRRIAAFFRDESCGQCVPCRVSRCARKKRSGD